MDHIQSPTAATQSAMQPCRLSGFRRHTGVDRAQRSPPAVGVYKRKSIDQRTDQSLWDQCRCRDRARILLATAVHGIADCQLQRLQSVQNAAARLLTGLRRPEHITPILKSLHWLPIRQRVTYKLATLVHKCINGRAPEYLAEFCHPSVDRRPGMRSADSGKLHVPRTQTSFGDRSFAIAGPRTWNNLSEAIQDSSLSFLTFAKLLKSYLFV